MKRIRDLVLFAATIASGIALALCLLPRPAHAATVKIKKDLTPTAAAPTAKGKTLTIIQGSKGRLRLKARHLAPNKTFNVLVNKAPVGSFTTNGSGSGKAKFSTHPGAKDLMLGFEPRGSTVTVQDDEGNDVMDGDIPDDGEDPNNIRCCFAPSGDDEGNDEECEELTPTECMAKGGTNAGSGTCIPDPCAVVTTQGEEITCCLPSSEPDDNGECEQRTAQSCSLDHGINLGAGSCDSNPCQTTPPADTIQCCKADDDGESECEHRTVDECNADGGISMGPGTCEPNPCGGGQPETVQCCVPNASGGADCSVQSSADCDAAGGDDKGPGTCDPNPCGGGNATDD